MNHLPKYIAYKAALLREKMVLSNILILVSFLFLVYFITSRVEIYNLYERLRKKEYILAPGVQDFTTVIPESVPDSYIHDAVTDFLSSLGNVNASNIIEEYNGLKKFMSDEFKVKFDLETKNWVEQVIQDDLTQIFKITNKKIISTQDGLYQVTAHAKVEFYAEGVDLGNEEQVIEMSLKLTHPDRHKRWFLQINHLKWSKLENFNTKTQYQKN